MPAALSTTKRKFHKILDSISNASSVSLVNGHDNKNASTTTLPASVGPPAKKPRVTRPVSAFVNPTVRVIATHEGATRPFSMIQPSRLASVNEDRKPPNFMPWDRAQFLERLKTYRHVDKWRGKSEKINEVEWSKRGWSCVGKERVGCVGGCGKEMVITLEGDREDREIVDEKPSQQEEDDDEDDWREQAQAQLVEKYAEMIIIAHNEGCLWRRRGCDDTIQRLSLAHQSTAIEGLRKRYTSLKAMASELPPNPSTPEDFDISKIHDQLLAVLSPPFEDSQSEATAPDPATDSGASGTLNSAAISLALFGWQAEEGHISGLATCTACFRRLGLWLFKPSLDSSNPSSMERLDVIGEHRDYCPWINALSQNGAPSRRKLLDGLAGWQVLLRAVQAIALHEKYDTEKTPATTPEDLPDDTASEIDGIASLATMKESRTNEEEKDKERWAKLKRLKQAFNVKRSKGKDNTRKKTEKNVG